MNPGWYLFFLGLASALVAPWLDSRGDVTTAGALAIDATLLLAAALLIGIVKARP